VITVSFTWEYTLTTIPSILAIPHNEYNFATLYKKNVTELIKFGCGTETRSEAFRQLAEKDTVNETRSSKFKVRNSVTFAKTKC
jgi:hypothetical protein